MILAFFCYLRKKIYTCILNWNFTWKASVHFFLNNVNFTWLSWEKNKNICTHTALKICNIATTFSGQNEKKTHLLTAFQNLPVEEEASIKRQKKTKQKKQCIYYLNVSKPGKMYFNITPQQCRQWVRVHRNLSTKKKKIIYLLLNPVRSWKQ